MSEYTHDKFDSWTDFCRKVEDYKKNPKEKWIFRGNKPGRPLESSLDRAVRYYPGKLSKRNKAEERLLRDFKRRYHQYSSDAPKEDDNLEWFSIMQHHGAPTRLLDFTYSGYIAAYFALEHTPEDPEEYSGKNNGKLTFEIFAINAIWARDTSVKKFDKSEDQNFLLNKIGNEDNDRKYFENCFMSKSPKKFACPFNPFRLTERISLQNGVFMCPGDVNETFENNLMSLEDWNIETNIF